MKRKTSVEVWRYYAQVPRVRVRLKIRRRIAEFLKIQTPYIQSLLSRDVWGWTIAPRREMDAKLNGKPPGGGKLHIAGLSASFLGDIAGFRTSEIILDFKPHQWTDIQMLAEHLGVDTSAVIRAALAERAEQIRKFQAGANVKER